MLKIELTLGLTAIIDKADRTLVEEVLWRAVGGKWTYYARGWIEGKAYLMHRWLMLGSTDSELVVDHINGNGWDNRRSNLRLVTVSQNNYNRQRKCPFVGVKHYNGKWQYWDCGLKTWLGSHEHALDAAMCFDRFALSAQSDVKLNFPRDSWPRVREPRSYPRIPEVL